MTTATLPIAEPSRSSASTGVAFFADRSSLTVGAEWKMLIDDLLRIYGLGDDWDGAGADTPDRDCVIAAMDWIREMAKSGPDAIPPNYVSLTPGGELLVVWQTETEYLEAEIVSPMEVEWMRCVEGTPGEHWSSGVTGVVQRW